MRELSVELKIVDHKRTQENLNKIKNLFSREAHDDFIEYVYSECLEIYEEKINKKETIYVPQFCIIDVKETKVFINSKYKGYGITFGMIVGDIIKSRNVLNCGLNISYFNPFEDYPSDEILDEYSRVNNLIKYGQENNYQNIKYDLPESIL